MLAVCNSSRNHLADAFLQPIRLFCRKDTLHQKLFAFGRRHLLQQRPRAAVLRFVKVRAENNIAVVSYLAFAARYAGQRALEPDGVHLVVQ